VLFEDHQCCQKNQTDCIPFFADFIANNVFFADFFRTDRPCGRPGIPAFGCF